MLKIILADGAEFQGANAAEIVIQLKLDDWTAHMTTKQYKNNMKHRVKNFYGVEISYSNDEEFLQELQRISFIRFIVRNA